MAQIVFSGGTAVTVTQDVATITAELLRAAAQGNLASFSGGKVVVNASQVAFVRDEAITSVMQGIKGSLT
jgi:hypothetical protein